jgi:alanyl-tRNA synthetase
VDSGSQRVVRMHTATHLLGAALRQVLGAHVHQRGSNITEQRLRFDFSHPERLTDAQLARVQEIVNAKISEGLEVQRLELPREEAEKLGAEREFGAVYPDVVSVYVIGEFSKEFCGGPHVRNTRQVGRFRITRQESSGAGGTAHQGRRRVIADVVDDGDNANHHARVCTRWLEPCVRARFERAASGRLRAWSAGRRTAGSTSTTPSSTGMPHRTKCRSCVR